MNLQVQCYAGRKADERPVRFQLGDRDYVVEEMVDQWYGPGDIFYKVRADDGNLYILRHGAEQQTNRDSDPPDGCHRREENDGGREDYAGPAPYRWWRRVSPRWAYPMAPRCRLNRERRYRVAVSG